MLVTCSGKFKSSQIFSISSNLEHLICFLLLRPSTTQLRIHPTAHAHPPSGGLLRCRRPPERLWHPQFLHTRPLKVPSLGSGVSPRGAEASLPQVLTGLASVSFLCGLGFGEQHESQVFILPKLIRVSTAPRHSLKRHRHPSPSGPTWASRRPRQAPAFVKSFATTSSFSGVFKHTKGLRREAGNTMPAQEERFSSRGGRSPPAARRRPPWGSRH